MWSPSQRITWNAGSSIRPDIAVGSSGQLHVVWADFTPGNLEIYYKKSTDGGYSWMPSQRITWNSGDSAEPALAVDSSGNVHVVWFDDTPGNREIFYKKSTDEGSMWMSSQRITPNIRIRAC
jgi:hypothetical protein